MSRSSRAPDVAADSTNAHLVWWSLGLYAFFCLLPLVGTLGRPLAWLQLGFFIWLVGGRPSRSWRCSSASP
jgi:hypothetical protein